MKNITLHTTILACAACLLPFGCGSSTPEVQEAHEEATPPAPQFTQRRLLTGPDGVQVMIAEFGTDQAYFKIVGVRSPAANFVFDANIVDQGGGRIRYQTRWDGGDYYAVHQDTGRGDSIWRLYAPGLSEALVLEYNEAGGAEVDADALHAEHFAQQRDGSLERVQTFDRPAAQARTDEDLARNLARTEEACGGVPQWSINWESISDETLKSYSIASYCGNVLSAMRNLCRWDPGKAFVQSLSSTTCAWADEWSLTRTDGQLAFVIAADTTNLEQKAREALLQEQTASNMTLDEAISYARSDVCVSEDESHVLVVHPHVQGKKLGVSYGTVENLFHTPQAEGSAAVGSLTRGNFAKETIPTSAVAICVSIPTSTWTATRTRAA